MKIKRMCSLRTTVACILLLVSVSVAATFVEKPTDDFAIGGAIYTDMANPLSSGEPDVTVTVSGVNGTYTGISSGSMGIWQVNDVPEGTYTVTPSKVGMGFQHLVGGVPDGLSSITITVNAGNMANNQSVQFLAGDPAEYRLDVSVIGGHGSVSVDPDSSVYLTSTQVAITAIPDQGYRVAAWNGIDEGSTANDLNEAMATMTEDKAVTVEFELIPPNMYTLTVQQPADGSIQISPQSDTGTYPEGTVVTLIASPDAGFQVKSWSGTDNAPASGISTDTITITQDSTVTVEFQWAFTIGGAIYTDLENPMTSGLSDVKVTVSGNGETYTTTTNGSQGIWQISNLIEGTYTVTPSSISQSFEYLANGVSTQQSSSTINVNPDNEAENQSIQFLATASDNLSITKITVKAGKTRSSFGDSMEIKGASFDALYSDFSIDNYIYLYTVSPGWETEDRLALRVDEGKFKNGKFSYKMPGFSIKFDLNKNTFSIKGKYLNLTGLNSSVTVRIEVGNYVGKGTGYDGGALGSGGNLDVVNGKKSMPVQFMMGVADALRVDKCTFKLGTRKPSTDSLTIQGTIAVEDDSVNLASKDITVSWGNYSITLPANDMYRIGYKKSFKYKKPGGTNGSIAAAIFDLEKCTFKVIIKKAAIGSQDDVVDFGIKFGQFDEIVTVPLTRKNASTFAYP